jgi:hypothetical protein
MFKSVLALVNCGFLLILAGCVSWNTQQQEQRIGNNQKETRPWYRSVDSVGGALEKQERAKPSRPRKREK